MNPYYEGYVIGKNFKFHHLSEKFHSERYKIQEFTLKVNQDKVLYHLRVPGFYLFNIIYLFLTFLQKEKVYDGYISLRYHVKNNDFFTKLFYMFKEYEFTGNVVEYVNSLFNTVKNTDELELKINLNFTLFGFLRGLTENIVGEELEKNFYSLPIDKELFYLFSYATDQFVAQDNRGNVYLLAGYPWFDQMWGRDTFISVEGILLKFRRFEEAKKVFLFFSRYMNDGIIPNLITLNGETVYNTVDASLWYVESIYRYYKITKDKDFIQEIFPKLENIVESYTTGKNHLGIRMDTDGLIISPAQFTWMDAAPERENPVTPRNGKPVEIQGLWYNTLKILSEFYTEIFNNVIKTIHLETLAEETKNSIKEKFWNKEKNFLYDVLDGDPHKDAVRPNVLFLISLSQTKDLLELETVKKVVSIVVKELLTPYGLRTLSRNDEKYIGKYETFKPQKVKDKAYHQGTVWPWLLGSYIDVIKTLNNTQTLSSDLSEKEVHNINILYSQLMNFIFQTGGVPEVFDGDNPYNPGGTVSQMWSVSEITRHFM